MIQPRNYPEFVGQALVLEPEPFVALVDDDNPWIEGLFLTVVIGVMIGLARFCGGLLVTATLPEPQALMETLMLGYGRFGAALQGLVDPLLLQQAVRRALGLLFLSQGYGAGWPLLLLLIVVPLAYVIQWLFLGTAGYAIAKLLGGTGTLNQTLGAMALGNAPQLLYLFTIVPFVSVGGGLVFVWSILIHYRALAVAHELSWQRAGTVTLLLVGVTALLLCGIALLAGLGLSTWLGGLL